MNEHLLLLLSDTVRNAQTVEETINRQLESMIEETSQLERRGIITPGGDGTLAATPGFGQVVASTPAITVTRAGTVREQVLFHN